MFEYFLRHDGVASRMISAENTTGEKGKGGMSVDGPARGCAKELGQGWKLAPAILVRAGATATLGDVSGCGMITHIWMTFSVDTPQVDFGRETILRIWWDGAETPAVECPLGDFFATQETFSQVSSATVCVNPRKGLNCYWKMPYRKGFRMTVENRSEQPMILYYQIDYLETEVPTEMTYFHAQFRRTNPLPFKSVFTVLDGVKGHGTYVGTYMIWGTREPGIWCEGEFKFYLDGDTEFPTICGTGTEDYFGGAYAFQTEGKDRSFSSPFSGCYVWEKNVGAGIDRRFSMYRWHIEDPVFFDSDIRVTVQALGWYETGLYKPLTDDISATAFFYLDAPVSSLPPLPDPENMRTV